MASAVRRLGSLSMARGCARIDAGPDTAKIGSAESRPGPSRPVNCSYSGTKNVSTHGLGRVGMWRGGVRSSMRVAAPFVRRCLSGLSIAPFPHPSHRTGHADLPHPALGQDFTPSPTTDPGQAGSDVRARSARRDARVDKSRLGVA